MKEQVGISKKIESSASNPPEVTESELTSDELLDELQTMKELSPETPRKGRPDVRVELNGLVQASDDIRKAEREISAALAGLQEAEQMLKGYSVDDVFQNRTEKTTEHMAELKATIEKSRATREENLSKLKNSPLVQEILDRRPKKKE